MSNELIKVQKHVVFGKEKKQLTINNIAIAILELLPKHIGRRNAISKEKLFQKLFKKPFQDSLEDEVRWIYTRRALHRLRQRTKCFVISENRDDGWVLFVIENDQEAQLYINNLENTIKKMRSMMKRAQTSVDQNWSQQPWVLPQYSHRKVLPGKADK